MLATLTGMPPIPAAADENHSHHSHGGGDLLLFPAIQATHYSKTNPAWAQNDLEPLVDIFYSTERDRLRFLAEFLADKDEQEMERLQVGWLAGSNTTLWAGRFHSPLGFWNSQHHHGAYMQTTITRPRILAFEDEAGVLPTHILGVLVDGSAEQAGGDLNYALGIGQGPELKDALEPVDILNPQGRGKLTAGAKLSYRPENGGEFGMTAGYANIPLVGPARPFDSNEQTVLSLFYNYESDRLKFVGEAFRLINHLKAPGISSRAHFSAAYLQPEFKVSSTWTAYGRIETTRNTGNNAYLDLVPEFVTSSHIAGSRFELGKSQAVKLELSHHNRQDSTHYNQFSLQWSMVYP
jgi:hypothetical protein